MASTCPADEAQYQLLVEGQVLLSTSSRRGRHLSTQPPSCWVRTHTRLDVVFTSTLYRDRHNKLLLSQLERGLGLPHSSLPGVTTVKLCLERETSGLHLLLFDGAAKPPTTCVLSITGDQGLDDMMLAGLLAFCIITPSVKAFLLQQ